MNCDVCKKKFDEVERRPKILPCGHTLCLSCAKNTGKCHVDSAEFDDAEGLVDNFFIINFIATSSHGKRFYCLTCKIPARAECLDEHDIRNIRNVRTTEVAPKLDALRESAALQQDIVCSLVEMLPAVSDSFNQLAETATLKHSSQQLVLEKIQGALEECATGEAWRQANAELEEAVRRRGEERAEQEQLLALLRSQAVCRLDLDGQRAEIDLSEETPASRALRFVLYHLSITGNLQGNQDDNEENDQDSDWEDVEADVEPQGAACIELQRAVRPVPSGSRDGMRRGRRRPSPRRDNYELLKTLEEQGAVPSMEPFECRVCLDQHQAGDGVILKGCLHTFCRSCLRDTVQHSETAEVRCPYQDEDYSCENVLSQREIKTLVPQDIFDLHLDRSIKVAESSMANTFHCKTVDCVGWCQFEPGVNQFVCPVCMYKNCLQCQVIHDPENCAAYQERIKRQAETDVEARQTQQQLEAMLATGNAMRCPKCNVVIMKRSGCDALTCAMCQLAICWATKQARWGPNGVGDTSGGCRCKVNGRLCHPQCGNCH